MRGRGLLVLLAPVAVASEYGSVDDLPMDASGHLAENVLLMSRQGVCATGAAERRAWLEAAPWVKDRIMGWATAALAEDAGFAPVDEQPAADADQVPIGCMRAVCVNRGIPAWGAMLVAPRFVPEPESNGAGVFEELSSWIVDNCQTAEVGIVSYHTGPAVLSFVSGADGPGARERELGAIEPGERHTQWRHARLGDRWIVRDSKTYTVLRNETVDYDKIFIVGDRTWSMVGSDESIELDKEKEQRILATRDLEWGRSKAVKSTYTPLGFAKHRLPGEVWADMLSYYHNNRRENVTEEWDAKGLYVNWWEVDPQMIALPWSRKSRWHEMLQPLVSEWAGGVELEPTDLYGMRIYQRGGVLLSHVDREETHALSAIINIAQGPYDEPWPLEIYDHVEHQRHLITMEPGEIVFYESARCMHGRPIPLRGDFYVNLFAHYRPRGDPGWFKKERTWNGEPPPCLDYHPECEGWAKGGECDANPMFMRDSCFRSCGVCGGERDSDPREEL